MSGCLLNFSEWLAPSELAIRSDYNTDEHPVSIGPKLLSPSLVSSSTEPKLIFSSTHYFDVMIQTQITRELSSTSQDITEPPVPDLLQQVYEMLNKIKIVDDVQLEDNLPTHSRRTPVQTDDIIDTSQFSSQPSSPPEVLDSPTSLFDPQQCQIEQLEQEVHRLKAETDELKDRLRTLESNYKNLLIELVGFQRGMADQDKLMQALISYFLGHKNSTSSVLTPEPSPLPASTMIPSPIPLPRSAPKSHPLRPSAFTLRQSLDQPLSPLPTSADSNNANASMTDPTRNYPAERNSMLSKIIDLDDQAGDVREVVS